ncbi:MAG TPA: dipeptidase [Acidobacteriota bacterium]|nr:dipeptidase [Acidobacteriota bacterium]
MSAPGPHDGFFTIDTHIDTPTASLMRDGWDFGARHDRAVDRTQCDLPRMLEGGIDALGFAVFVTQAVRSPAGFALAHEKAVHVFERIHAVVTQHADRCGIALRADDGPRLKAEGRRALYLAIENSYSLGLDAGNVAKFHALGVRMLGLNHMLHNDVADSSTDPRPPEWGGLSPFGKEVMAECNRLGIALDASHASDDALWDLIALSATPPLLTHSGCRAVCDHPRNIGDELLRALAAKGGVIQINALPIAVKNAPGNRQTEEGAKLLLKLKDLVLTPEVRAQFGGEWARIDREHPAPKCSLDDYVAHVEHAVAVAGIDHVGVGCDFDGGGGVAGLDQVSDYPNLTHALRARGWSDEALAKLWGQNTLRVLRSCEAHAAKRQPDRSASG